MREVKDAPYSTESDLAFVMIYYVLQSAFQLLC